jgi:16S rRNA U1498 N3-methylase RsmE
MCCFVTGTRSDFSHLKNKLKVRVGDKVSLGKFGHKRGEVIDQ